MRYVNQVVRIMKFLVTALFPDGGDLAYDMTLGTGKDSDFLSEIFRKVISLDIQEDAVRKYSPPENVTVLVKDHSSIGDFSECADLIVYNLGYLPGGDENITTLPDTTIKSFGSALKLLKKGGFLMAAVYTGHDGGYERDKVLEFFEGLDYREYSVLRHTFTNRPGMAPELFVLEKRG